MFCLYVKKLQKIIFIQNMRCTSISKIKDKTDRTPYILFIILFSSTCAIIINYLAIPLRRPLLLTNITCWLTKDKLWQHLNGPIYNVIIFSMRVRVNWNTRTYIMRTYYKIKVSLKSFFPCDGHYIQHDKIMWWRPIKYYYYI